MHAIRDFPYDGRRHLIVTITSIPAGVIKATTTVYPERIVLKPTYHSNEELARAVTTKDAVDAGYPLNAIQFRG